MARDVLSFERHLAVGIGPAADFMSGTVYTDIVNMKNFQKCAFVIQRVTSTGTSTITVEACDDVAGSNVSAIPFSSRDIVTGDTPGTYTARAATGYIPAAGAEITEIEVDADQLAASGYHYVRLKAVESVNDPVTGAILIELYGARYSRTPDTTAIV
jgi:hypothetical protein